MHDPGPARGRQTPLCPANLAAQGRPNPPLVRPAGTAAPFENQAITTAGTYDLQALATDGVRGGTPSQQRSGVHSVELQLSKNEGAYQTVKTETTSGCAGDSCEGAATYPIDTAALGDGLHAVKAIVKDRLYGRPVQSPDAEGKKQADHNSRHVKERIVKFYVDLLPPTLDAPTHNPALPTGWVSDVALSATVVGRDAGTGVKSIALTKPTPAGNVLDTRPTKNTQGTDCTLSTASTSRCPKVTPVTPATRFDYTTRDLAEGANVRPSLK